MKKLTALLLAATVSLASFGHHHHGPHRFHHHGSGHFWTGVAAGALLRPFAPPPPPPPFPYMTRIWVPARVETRYDAWGRPYLVTIPGHWE